MPTLIFGENSIPLTPGNTILESMEQAGIELSNACRSGDCQSCLLVCSKGSVPAESQLGLKSTQQHLGYFLPCICPAQNNLTAHRVDNPGPFYRSSFLEKKPLYSKITQLRLAKPTGFHYQAGQFAMLAREDGLAHPYALTSQPSQSFLEFHILQKPTETMSLWLSHDLHSEASLNLRGPLGHCVYVPANKTRPILMVGDDTGLAPIYGILNEAHLAQHHAPIYLYHGVASLEDGYLQNELTELSKKWPQFVYQPVLQPSPTNPQQKDLNHHVMRYHGNLKDWQIYLCGSTQWVNPLKKQCFLAGAAVADIHQETSVETPATPGPGKS